MTTIDHQDAMVTRLGVFNMQVCVPKDWTDEQAKRFADRENVCGTSGGWFVHKTEKDPVRVDCEERPGFVHIVLTC